MTKSEIEKELAPRGDFVRIDYLTRYIKENPPFDLRRFAYQKLAEIYEKRGMFSDAARCFDSISQLSVSSTEKVQSYVKETELFIKAGEFERADESMKRAVGESEGRQREEIKFALKDFYKRQALVYEKENRRNNATKIYEKLLTMDINSGEREEIKKKLLGLYEQLGRVKEFLVLQKKFDEM